MYQFRFQFRIGELHEQKQKREGRRIGLKEVATACGLSSQTISNMKASCWGYQSNPHMKYLIALCKFYDCTLNDMVEIIEEPSDGSEQEDSATTAEVLPDPRNPN